MRNSFSFKLLILAMLFAPLLLVSKDFDANRIFGIKINMPEKEALKLLDEQKAKHEIGTKKYKQKHYVVSENQTILNASVERVEIGIKEDKVDFISFDIPDTDVNNFAQTLRDDANSYEDFRDLGYRMTKFYYDDCTLSFIFFLDEGKISFAMISGKKKE